MFDVIPVNDAAVDSIDRMTVANAAEQTMLADRDNAIAAIAQFNRSRLAYLELWQIAMAALDDNAVTSAGMIQNHEGDSAPPAIPNPEDSEPEPSEPTDLYEEPAASLDVEGARGRRGMASKIRRVA